MADSDLQKALLIQQLRGFVGKNSVAGWDEAWKASVTPWEIGEVQPAFYDLLKSDQVELPRSGRALVPGSGRAYDAICIANELGLETWAIDVSPTAVKAAIQLVQETAVDHGSVVIRTADFFTFEPPREEKFELIYDYTFFVAILPEKRKEWGRKISSLIKPGGYLITLIFPLVPPHDEGPPYYVKSEHYVEVLGEGWEKVLDKIPERSSESHVGKERLVVWRREL